MSPSADNAPVLSRLNAPRLHQVLLIQPALSQRLRVADVAQQVYAAVPSIPLENEYIDDETGDIASDNTLLSRFIRYHLYVVRRSPDYRLDWKISLADYLGVNEWMKEDDYPGGNDLRDNPLNGDMAAIDQLTRTERDALVQELVRVFSLENDRLPTYLSR